MRRNLRYTPTHAVQQEPMKSTREVNCFRLVSDGFVPRSRTITRTICASSSGAEDAAAGAGGLQLPEVFRSSLGDLLPTLPSKLDGGGLFFFGKIQRVINLLAAL